jgi:hypothetical protein
VLNRESYSPCGEVVRPLHWHGNSKSGGITTSLQGCCRWLHRTNGICNSLVIGVDIGVSLCHCRCGGADKVSIAHSFCVVLAVWLSYDIYRTGKNSGMMTSPRAVETSPHCCLMQEQIEIMPALALAMDM